MKKNKSFREWFFNDYLMKLQLSSPLISGNKNLSDKHERICKVAEYIIANPTINVFDLRKYIALSFFVSMRTSLDYINYAKMFIDEWNKK